MTLLLLDTHVWIWASSDPSRLADAVRRRIEQSAGKVYLSAVSSWEIAIKFALGRLSLPSSPEVFVPEQLRAQGIGSLPVEQAHALRVATLPLHHRDPFDRMLVAQAQILGATLVTADRDIERYDVDVLRAG